MREYFFDGSGVRRSVKNIVAGLFLGLGLLAGGFFVFTRTDLVSREKRDQLALALNRTLLDLFYEESKEPAYEVDLSAPRNGSTSVLISEKIVSAPYVRKTALEKERKIPALSEAIQTSTSATVAPARECDFYWKGEPNHRVLINEVAWMGSERSASAEWLELRNNWGQDISLAGWRVISEDGDVQIIFSEKDLLPSGGLYLLERSNDSAVSGVRADKIYAGSLSNSQGWLRLFGPQCDLADEVDATAGWKKLGGNNTSKQTLERNVMNFGWHTSILPGGTPRTANDFLTDEATYASSGGGVAAPLPENIPAPTSSVVVASSTPTEIIVHISEVQVGTDAGASDEFVELWNAGGNAVDLTGWYIKKKSGSGAESSLVSATRLTGKSIPAGKYFLLANEGGYKGSVSPDATWASSNTLAYTSNAIALYDSTGKKITEVAWSEILKNQSYARQADGGLILSEPTPQNSTI